MADEANGLIPGIMIIAYSLLYLNTGEFFYAAMMAA
jgi:hypothetical protein